MGIYSKYKNSRVVLSVLMIIVALVVVITVNYMFVSRTELPQNLGTNEVLGANWETEANARIEQIRKRNVNIKVVDSQGRAINGAQVKIDQQKNHFAFGTAINHNEMQNWATGTPSVMNNYERFVVENFEWVVAENAHKWTNIEWNRDNVTFERGDKLAEFARKNDLRMRGHATFWGSTYSDTLQPPWVIDLRNRIQNTSDSATKERLKNELKEEID